MAYTWGHNIEVANASLQDNLRRWNSPEDEAKSRKGDRIQVPEDYTCKMCDDVFEVRNQKDINAHLKQCKKSMKENLRAEIKLDLEAKQASFLPAFIAKLVSEEIAKRDSKGKGKARGRKKNVKHSSEDIISEDIVEGTQDESRKLVE